MSYSWTSTFILLGNPMSLFFFFLDLLLPTHVFGACMLTSFIVDITKTYETDGQESTKINSSGRPHSNIVIYTERGMGRKIYSLWCSSRRVRDICIYIHTDIKKLLDRQLIKFISPYIYIKSH